MNQAILCATQAKENRAYLLSLNTDDKNKMLTLIADALIQFKDKIIDANAMDLTANSTKPQHILDRLMLNDKRIIAIADGIRDIVKLSDPIGEVLESWVNKEGLAITKTREPFGVIGVIYEARPNVTADVIGLCIKSSNAVVLRGGSDAINSNKALVGVIKAVLTANGYNPEFIQLITDTARQSASDLMCARGYVDVLIPRGSAALIENVVLNANVPVIETGSGNCHAYIHSTASVDKAIDIIINGKTQRPSVCNALESILVDEAAAAKLMPKILDALISSGVEIRGDQAICALNSKVKLATDIDYATEFLGYTISVKTVKDYVDAVNHINKYSTHHSEVILADDKTAIEYFLKFVDSATVYANASTRFTDGFVFGFGAEIGISTQKLHARGPMGLKELTTTKYRIVGNGQFRQ